MQPDWPLLEDAELNPTVDGFFEASFVGFSITLSDNDVILNEYTPLGGVRRDAQCGTASEEHANDQRDAGPPTPPGN